MYAVVLAQVGFSSAAMLAWGAAALIPLVLHLWRQRRRISVPWAAMQLLRQVQAHQARRAKLFQWLLVLLRMSLLVVLALALARPFWTSSTVSDGTFTQPVGKLWILVVDTSYSMGYRADQLTRLERATERAMQILAGSRPGDAYALIAAEDPARGVVVRPTLDRQRMAAEIQRLTDTALGCDLASALTMADQIAQDGAQTGGVPRTVEIVLFSDLSSDSWQSAVDGPAARLWQQLQQRYRVTIEPIVDTRPVNMAVETLTASATRVVTGNPINVQATIANFSEAVTGLEVVLELSGQVVARQRIDVPSYDRQTVQFEIKAYQPGMQVLSVSIPTDRLLIDNYRDLIIDVRSAHRVLIVAHQTQVINAWDLALRSHHEATRVIAASKLPTMSLKDWDIIVIDNPTPTGLNSLERLTEYVHAGGAVIMAIGSNLGEDFLQDIQPNTLTALTNLLGCRLRSASQYGSWDIDPLEYSSPVVSAFAGFPNSGLLTTPIFRYWVTDVASAELQVDLALATGKPLIVRHALGQGTVATWLSAPEDGQNLVGKESWNIVAGWPSFLPLAQQLANVLVSDDLQRLNVLAGQPLTLSVPAAVDAVAFQLIRPDQQTVQLMCQPSTTTEGNTCIYPTTDRRGVYRLTGPNVDSLFAVNINARQSDLRRLDPALLSALKATVYIPDRLTEMSGSAVQNDSVARYLLILLGGLLIGESCLAWFLGRRTA
ncbi:MAG: VWA domain-containing protein [Pirellulaceae bacterium]|nr:VWA domain-containing protein [Pirellulaceae bacterium]